MKRCSRCGESKAADQFYKQPKSQPTKDGLTYWCKACYAAHYRENRERQLRSSERSRIRRQYGLSVEEYRELIARGCAVCGSHDRMVIDHCHETERVRNALCTGCNLALGAVGDDPERLELLAAYLREQPYVTPNPNEHPPRYRGPDGDELRRLYVDEGYSFAQIGEMYGVSWGGVRKHALNMGIKSRGRGSHPRRSLTA
jgi:hypothetical protein